MTDVEKQDSQKTVVAFVAGLLIGGLLVWVFSGSTPADAPAEVMMEETTSESTTDEAVTSESAEASDTTATAAPVAQMQTGAGAITVDNQPAGSSVAIGSATFPNDEGWIAVRSYENDQLGNILGAARFSKEQNLVPQTISLLTPTMAGKNYAVVFFTEDGNREFNLSGDAQVEGVWKTFTAQ